VCRVISLYIFSFILICGNTRLVSRLLALVTEPMAQVNWTTTPCVNNNEKIIIINDNLFIIVYTGCLHRIIFLTCSRVQAFIFCPVQMNFSTASHLAATLSLLDLYILEDLSLLWISLEQNLTSRFALHAGTLQTQLDFSEQFLELADPFRHFPQLFTSLRKDSIDPDFSAFFGSISSLDNLGKEWRVKASACDNSRFLVVPDWYSHDYCGLLELVQT
jgi:hypothetical protein